MIFVVSLNLIKTPLLFVKIEAIETPDGNRSLAMNIIAQHIILSSGIVELTKNEPVDNSNNF